MSGRPLPTPAEVEKAVAEVYSRPEFEARELPGFLRWAAERWAALKAWFWELVERFNVLESTAPVLYWGIVAWLALSALAILAHFGTTAYQVWRARERKTGTGAPGAEAARPVGAADWEALARRAAAAGRLRDAALALYQALLLRLDARGVVRYDPAKTPGEYRWEAMAHGEVARVLEAFLRGFEPVAFGGRELDAPGYERLRRIAAEGGAHG